MRYFVEDLKSVTAKRIEIIILVWNIGEIIKNLYRKGIGKI